MAIRKYKPTTPGRRGASGADFSEVTRSEPEKSLVRPLHSKGGRNVHGRITTRHQGGGHKRAYRLIDFRRKDKDGVPAKVAHIEYDPNRTARIALLHYADGEKRYILAPERPDPGRPGRERAGRGHQDRATACRCATSRPAPSCTRSSCGPAAAPRSPARPGPASSCWPRRAACAAAHAVRRDQAGRRRLPGHHRRGRQRRAGQHQARQGGPEPVEGQAPDRSAASR